MKRDEIARMRMKNQHLWGRPFQGPIDVIRHLAAAQAQDFGIAKWSVAQRARRVNNLAMDRLFWDGAILRTHLLRPTWHFVLPADIRWVLELTAPRVNAMKASRYRKLGLDDELFAKTNSLFAKSLRGGRRLTRKELTAVLGGAGITASGMQMGYILMRAELDAVICSGGRKGKQQTYALFDQRVPRVDSPDKNEALAELTRRYFTARGPATLKDYVWWSSLTTRDARRGLEMIGSELESQVVEGRTYWFAKGATVPKAKEASTRVDLVQGLDECIVSYRESKDVLFPTSLGVPVPLNEIVFNHVILLNGHVIGQWRPVSGRSSVMVETILYRPLDRVEEDALDAAVERYSAFLDLPTTLLRTASTRFA